MSAVLSPWTSATPGQCPAAGPAPELQGQHWLHVVSHTDPRYGGLSSAVPALAASVRAESRGSEVPVDTALAAFCAAGQEHVPAALDPSRITFWPTSRVTWARDRGLRARFDEQVRRADGLHVHGLWEGSTSAACRVARRLRKPYVLSAHGMLEPWALAAKRRKKQIYAALVERGNVAGAACLHALTEAEAVQYRSFGARGPIAVIPNAVAVPEGADAGLLLQRFPELEGKRLVLFLSRLHPKKGLDLLVESWAALSRAYPEAHLVLAGPDSEGMEAGLTEQISRHDLRTRVTFTGMLSGAWRWSALRAAHCYVLPSYSEGLSMALLEAMGMGVPVIATRACNMPEITQAGAGWEIAAEVAALTAALREALALTGAEAGRIGDRGAALIRARYTPAVVAGQTAAMYRWVLGGGERPMGLRLLDGGER